jgi:hypothetical protein
MELMMTFTPQTGFRFLLTSVALAAFNGCSATNQMDYGKVELVSVSGTVTLDGKPLAGAVITFDNTENGTFSFARTDSSGGYTLQFDSEKNGVLVGKKTVQISTTRTVLGLAGEEGAEEGGGGEAASGEGEASTPAEKKEELVPACYNKESKLTVEVTDSTSTFNFDLKSDCSTTGATP